MTSSRKTFFATVTQHIWSFFASGLLTILPLALTVALFHFSLRLLKGWFEPIQKILLGTRLGEIPHIEIITVFALIFIIGMLMKIFILHSLVIAIEKIIFRIPLVRAVYSGIKQLVHAFNPHDKVSFKKVVLIEFPRKGTFSIGFLTGSMPADISPGKGEKFYNVFVPHTPNPTSGFLVMVSEEEISIVDLTRQEAMALIISGGIIIPERLKGL